MAKGRCPACGKQHFGLCHKCPHAGEEMDRIWKRRRWEDTPCAACALSEDGRAAGHGRGLSLEHVPPRELLEHGAEEWPRRDPFEWLKAEDPREVVRRLCAFFRAWIAASDDELRWLRDYVAWNLAPEEVARRDGITAKAAGARRGRVMRMLGMRWNAEEEEWEWVGGNEVSA